MHVTPARSYFRASRTHPAAERDPDVSLLMSNVRINKTSEVAVKRVRAKWNCRQLETISGQFAGGDAGLHVRILSLSGTCPVAVRTAPVNAHAQEDAARSR